MSSVSVQSQQSSRGAPLADECYVALSAGALHDLVGPVNQIRWMVDLILKKHRDKLDKDDEVLFAFMQSSTERLQLLTSGLRTYMRAVGQPQPPDHFDANTVLSQALAGIRQVIEQSEARITYDTLPELYGDPNQICIALMNLIENSIKFRGDEKPRIHVKAISEGCLWLFSVCDNGIGIDPRHHDRVFDVFKRVHNGTYPGAGVGLAIAKHVIERHRGAIWVESRPGQGSTFFFTLPMATAQET